MIENAMEKMQHPCTHLTDMLEAQLPGILAEIQKNKFHLTIKNKHTPTEKETEQNYFDNYAHTWATGFKFAYCNCVCLDSKNCIAKEEGIDGGKKWNIY